MIADVLLERLEQVRPTGFNKWIARCPAHQDRRPSLSIKVADGEKLLLHCHAGCPAADVVAAVGLDLSDLFPPDLPGIHHHRPRVSALSPLIAVFENDLILVHLFLADVGNGQVINELDRATAKAAAGRIWRALQEARYVH